ncbi:MULTISPECIES: SCO4225 family membrane protein [unclassified Streptomyces]|uniref:SCO4225 family membrane protein n=1 Tax=unclassified Streptomyces TaxID=2593676 RepID=UPI002E17B2F3
MNARTLLRLTVTNPASAIYLGLVGASVVFTAGVVLFSPDPGFAGVWPFFLTAPTSLVMMGIMGAVGGLDAPVWLLAIGLAVSALLQSLALGATLQALRGRPHLGRTA